MIKTASDVISALTEMPEWHLYKDANSAFSVDILVFILFIVRKQIDFLRRYDHTCQNQHWRHRWLQYAVIY